MPNVKKCATVLAVLSIFFVTVTAAMDLDSTSSYQCNEGTVEIGSTEDEVKQKCGEPTKMARMGEESLVTWIYNRGDTEFVYYLGFLFGKVYRIQMGGYGD